MQLDKNSRIAIEAAIKGGEKIIEIYSSPDFEIKIKEDKSPLTKADKEANDLINQYLEQTEIPIISEENKEVPYEIRSNWTTLWMVDPLDGTKEFIKKNGEFTVNIALIKNGDPIFGVVYAPALKTLYFGGKQLGKSYKVEEISSIENFDKLLENCVNISYSADSKIRIVGSRSHMNDETQDYLEKVKNENPEKRIEIVPKGSSLKLCLLAEGLADIYPRFAPTMEWDTAAGHAVCETANVAVYQKGTSSNLIYNKPDLLNPHFLAIHG